MIDRAIRDTLIEACRADSADLQEPELAELQRHFTEHPEELERLEAVQAVDRRIAAAMQDVPLPLGLEARLLAALEGAQFSEPAAAPAPVQLPTKPTRRRFVVAAVSVAASLLLAIGGYWLLQPQGDYGLDSVIDRAQEQVASLKTDAAPRRPGPVLKSFTVPRQLASAVTGWRETTFLERRGVAIDVDNGRASGTLLIVRLMVRPGQARIVDVPEKPPRRPYTTGSSALAAWQSRGLLYVLVVDGGEGAYRELMYPSGAVAANSPLGARMAALESQIN